MHTKFNQMNKRPYALRVWSIWFSDFVLLFSSLIRGNRIANCRACNHVLKRSGPYALGHNRRKTKGLFDQDTAEGERISYDRKCNCKIFSDFQHLAWKLCMLQRIMLASQINPKLARVSLHFHDSLLHMRYRLSKTQNLMVGWAYLLQFGEWL